MSPTLYRKHPQTFPKCVYTTTNMSSTFVSTANTSTTLWLTKFPSMVYTMWAILWLRNFCIRFFALSATSSPTFWHISTIRWASRGESEMTAATRWRQSSAHRYHPTWIEHHQFERRHRPTFLISVIISLGSRDDVVFMLHVNLSDRGFTCSSLTALLQNIKQKFVQRKTTNLLS